MKTVANLKDGVAAILSGIDLSTVDGVYKAFERGARVLTQKIKAPETQGTQNITLYSGVTDYLIDQRIFGTTLLDIRPQGISRNSWDFVYKKFGDDFDRNKQFHQMGTQVAFDYSNGTPIIRIVTNKTSQQIILDAMNSTTGWVGSGINSIAIDSGVYYQSPASLRFTITGPVGTLTRTISSVDLSSYVGVGVGFMPIQIPNSSNATDLTGIEVRIGSDASNYYTATTTAGFLGAWTTGNWALVSFNGATAFGSPNMAKVTYLQIRLSVGTTITSFRLGGLWTSMPVQVQILYGSAGFFRIGNVVSQTIATDNDLIILSDPAYTIYEYECALSILQQTGGGASDSSIASINSILNGQRARNGMVVQMGLYDLYRAENPSAELRSSGSWYDNGQGYGGIGY